MLKFLPKNNLIEMLVTSMANFPGLERWHCKFGNTPDHVVQISKTTCNIKSCVITALIRDDDGPVKCLLPS